MSDTENTKPKKAAAKAAPKTAAKADSAVKVAKKPAVAKVSVDKVATGAEKKPAPKREKSTLTGATITIRQTGSPIRRTKDQRGTLIGLGLNKMGRTSTLVDTPSVRGMIAKVQHMVEVVT